MIVLMMMEYMAMATMTVMVMMTAVMVFGLREVWIRTSD